jgi:hypothetical protein
MSNVLKTMTDDEIYALIVATNKAWKAGDFEEEDRLLRSTPLHPKVAITAKNFYGPEELLKMGFDLSKAYEAFGDDWLEKK